MEADPHQLKWAEMSDFRPIDRYLEPAKDLAERVVEKWNDRDLDEEDIDHRKDAAFCVHHGLKEKVERSGMTIGAVRIYREGGEWVSETKGRSE